LTTRKNKLTLLEPTKIRSSNGAIIWKCSCECGKISYHVGALVKRNIITSCGCGRRSKNPWKSILKAKYQDYKWGAGKRNLEFRLSYKEFKKIVINKCYYCGSYPSATGRSNKIKGDFQVLINGIDRKNNNIGYIKENCVPCCKICNGAKRNLTYNKWIKWLDQIVKHRTKDLVTNKELQN